VYRFADQDLSQVSQRQATQLYVQLKDKGSVEHKVDKARYTAYNRARSYDWIKRKMGRNKTAQ
jgi:hypothetical protein